MKIDWMTTILTIIGALIGQALAANVSAIGDFIPVASTSIGTLASIIIVGGNRRRRRRCDGKPLGGLITGRQRPEQRTPPGAHRAGSSAISGW